MDLKYKKVFITGAEGFIGSHLTEKLVQLGANVTALVQYNSFNNWGWIDTFSKEVKDSINVVTGDMREYDGMKRIIKGQDVVFHLAALIAIPYSYLSPMAYVKTNVEGTTNVLEACREYEVEKIVHTSTSETYGTALYVPIDEKHPMQGQSPYSASKIAADKMAESFYRSFNLPVAIIRPFNTYGPRQSARAVIPTIISQILEGKTEIKLGSLSPTRDFNYVKDTAEAFIKVAESDKTIGQVINAGSNYEISIGDTVKKIINIMGNDVKILCDEERIRPEKSEVNRLWADNRKIKELTSWNPRYNLDDGLKETIEWIRNNMKYFKTDIYNV
ncbi:MULTISPECIES: NAD-dependent 4,6-dehydratase LegB [Clostridium]|uniref:NAD-dependent epimerase/dehydratase family protein n=2 Tax=Clostridium TaxID=1485 RepID=A0A846JB53_CLOBO|nr:MULTISPECIES: NAD-dependent 4,6-dehydratase LegB [Clostridium]NFH67295.1 NAD-dependent epimerase/dehydratase family protein [Clostridium botulinum]ACA56461.1 UDP-glucose 4-epimerase [Clostridium botulinum A3 str. Loch Maree]NFJ09093.1 NAD-dependent epimerase/dehydratase family protein [Clostridium botulinum]NFK13635.1 NAD-dependent epimerase/dehydratase family protein [Clostridium botulinum]NFM95176.1 NAD-dependent epimerase/dehydratase family protein [Clostridium botulinum]